MNNLDAVDDIFQTFSPCMGETPHFFRYQTKKQALSPLTLAK
ncbi:hypothetical protein [Candidatus Enterovibrio escicola]|uniref:Uncharacterized protein n=1 Tax=Candidatus Enterovibrio escicola TaxID=1927127 RepID=A0A2A5T6P1_9GAMM|nr:hypothetical protein [Candidatus Enterovibrio escacola]PCS23855.1 hypothetical protein BTN49_0826 [Candidatus Enterovibrio escacola]